ncbi:MAG: NAD-dependent epimerase/dehydratase family protein [Candidatus Omnitrophota bacterium]|nr:NAD-dependent epimerase/dehydratase family protein [Candidatus Omnitrophota bacterium]
MKILVTGATGFTGGYLVDALVERGHRVRALVRRKSGVTKLIAKGVELEVGDIRDAALVDRAVGGCEKVFHLAALYRDQSATKEDYWNVNVEGTQNIIDACLNHGVKRLVHCSTMGVHGAVAEIPGNEDSPFNPGDEYQRTKLLAEGRVWKASAERGLAMSIARPAAIYGPGEERFVKLFGSIQRGYFVMIGSGKTYYHMVYVTDLVEGLIQCAESDRAAGEAFFFGDENYVTLNDLAGKIAHILGVRVPRLHLPVWPFYAAAALCEAVCLPLGLRPPLYKRRVDFFTHNRAFDISKARDRLGYAPRVSLAEGLSKTATSYRAEGSLKSETREMVTA